MTKRVRLVVSACCALCAMLLCAALVNGVREDAERQRTKMLERYGGDMVTLVVTNRSLEQGETIAVSDVEERDWISSLAPEGALLSKDEVIGRVVREPAAANAPLCELNFREEAQALEVPAGHVAVSVPLSDRLGVPADVPSGTHVVAYEAKEGTAELVCSSALVLGAPSMTSATMGQGVITIAAPISDIPRILSTSTSGDLRLVVPASDVMDVPKEKERVSEVLPQKTDDKAEQSAGDEATGEA